MVMEAMRLSLLEHEEQQRKEEEKRKKEAAATAASEEHVEGDASPGRSSEDQTATDTVGNGASNVLSATRSSESGETLAETIAGQPLSSSQSHTPIDTTATCSDAGISIPAQPQRMTPMVGDAADSPASTLPNGVVKRSSHNASTPIDHMKLSPEPTGTPGVASLSSSIFSNNTPEQPSYEALPSSPESSMEEPLLDTDLLSVRVATETNH
jgi:hypothetical protein